MTEKTKNIFLYGGSILFGVFSLLILWQIPYLSGINAYASLACWGQGAFGVLLSLAQLFVLFGLFALIAVGLIGVLNTLGIINVEFKNTAFSIKLLNLILLGSVVALNLFAMIWCACLAAQFGSGLFGVGSIISLVFAIVFLTLAALEYATTKRALLMSEISQKYEEDKRQDEDSESEAE